MKYEIKDVNMCVKDIEITVPVDEASADYRTVLNKFKNYVVVPGFRKGKAPISMVENMFFEQAKETYLREKIYEYYEKAIEESKLQPLNEGLVQDVSWNKGEDLKAVFRFEVEPVVDIKDYTGLEVNYHHMDYEETMLDDSIEKMLNDMATFENVEGTIEFGDKLKVKISEQGTEDEIEIDELGEGTYDEEIEKEIVGHRVGETFDSKIESDEGDSESITITIIEAERFVVPELNEELAKSLDYESLEDMRNKLEEELKQELTKRARISREARMMLKIGEANPFDIPPSTFISYAMQLAEPYARLMNVKPEEVARYYYGQSINDIKSYYILSNLIEKLNPEPTDEDKQELVEASAADMNLSSEEFLEKNPDVTNGEGFVRRSKELKVIAYLTENNKFIPKSKDELEALDKEEMEKEQLNSPENEEE